MNYQQTIDFLYSQLPVFQKDGSSAYKPGLERIEKMADLTGNPEKKFKSIHIAGTNGKGSTSSMLASILMEAGLKVGLFTSPHLVDFRERIRVNGEMISKNFVVEYVSKYKAMMDQFHPSFFEYTTLMAFDYFKTNEVDIAIIETGLGGRLDCSNIVTPEISIITNIGIDHVQLLGNTLPLIASEKAGIIKPETPVVIGRKQSEIITVFEKEAANNKSEIHWASETTQPFELELKGAHQIENGKTVLTTIELLKNQGWNIPDLAIKNGFLNTTQNAGLIGRWQMISSEPKIICDTGHNEDGINAVVQQLKNEDYHQLHMVIGMMNDKEVNSILKLLPKTAHYYWCAPQYKRALTSTEIAQFGAENQLIGKAYNSVKEALGVAKNNAQTNDLIFIGGSNFVVAEAIEKIS